MHGDDLRTVDIEAREDLAEGLFPQPVGNSRVAPERPELRTWAEADKAWIRRVRVTR
jgi:hypothetical protein